jgi:hypothetical protein
LKRPACRKRAKKKKKKKRYGRTLDLVSVETTPEKASLPGKGRKKKKKKKKKKK